MMHKKANPTLLKFYEYKQGLKSLSPEGEGFNQLGDYKNDGLNTAAMIGILNLYSCNLVTVYENLEC
jgi:hypothetical protein